MFLAGWCPVQDVFDGDILEYVSPIEDELPRDTYVAEWRGYGFYAAWLKNGIPQYQGMDGLIGADEDMQIVGNVYEQPGLLMGASSKDMAA